MSSIFTRPRARPPLAAVSSQQNLIAVSTEDELLAALTSLPRSDGACYGRGIDIVGDIVLSKTIQLAKQHAGITISSPSRSKIVTRVNLDSAIDIFCPGVSITGLSISSGFNATNFIRLKIDAIGENSASDATIANNEIRSGANIASFVDASSVVVINCSVLSNRVYLDGPSCSLLTGSFGLTESAIIGNVNFLGGISTTIGRSSIASNARLGQCNLGGFGSCFTGNTMAGNIVILGERWSIIGNHLFGNDIDASASAGTRNTIVGNVEVNSILPAAFDAVTSNTL